MNNTNTEINLDDYDIHACRIIVNYAVVWGENSANAQYGKKTVETAKKVVEEWRKLFK